MSKHLIHILIVTFVIVGSIFSQQTGNATYYCSSMKGRHTSDGGKYHPDSMTCAHKTLPFGTILKVRNPKNDKEVIVIVTDRGPHQKRLMIDLSYSAAKQLDIIRQGIAQVEMTKLNAMPFVIPILYPLPIAISKLDIENRKPIMKMRGDEASIVQMND